MVSLLKTLCKIEQYVRAAGGAAAPIVIGGDSVELTARALYLTMKWPQFGEDVLKLEGFSAKDLRGFGWGGGEVLEPHVSVSGAWGFTKLKRSSNSMVWESL